jgi:N-methylhydantoinase B
MPLTSLQGCIHGVSRRATPASREAAGNKPREMLNNGGILRAGRRHCNLPGVVRPVPELSRMDPVELNLFASRLEAVCDEMGAVLRNAALSPNIRDRLDFSCAIFDAAGALCAQAAHIPVHLGSMAFAMRDIVRAFAWSPGDMVILNDPFLGGTHLPDVTLVGPVFAGDELAGFVANRAHHADIGAEAPGSMPVSSRLDEEGVVIEPVHLLRAGTLDRTVVARITAATRNPAESAGDLAAQLSANRAGLQRLATLIEQRGPAGHRAGLAALDAYGERLARDALRQIPDGAYSFEDVLDDDGQGQEDIAIRLKLTARGGDLCADFGGTAPQVRGNVNCPLAVTAAAVFYAARCLMPRQTPACAGAFRPITLHAPAGSLVNARRPAAVAAGNVETSTRIVDVVLGALARALPGRIPAASHGSMNNLAMGADRPGRRWDYYETIGGGMGAGPSGGGLSGVQTHMTNTRNTPVEVLESRYPVRVRRYRLRTGSGGEGRRRGGDGIVREIEFLEATRVSLLTERRRHAPWGLDGGAPGAPGLNLLNGVTLPGKCQLEVVAGDRLVIETAGGGGWGDPG